MARTGRIIGGRFVTHGSNSRMRAARARSTLRRAMRRSVRGRAAARSSSARIVNIGRNLRMRRSARLIQRVYRGSAARRSVRLGGRNNPIVL